MADVRAHATGFRPAFLKRSGDSKRSNPARGRALLADIVRDPLHVYFGSLPSPVEQDLLGSFKAILGSGQATDAYLLALARRRHATFVTFDTRLRSLAGSSTQTEILGI